MFFAIFFAAACSGSKDTGEEAVPAASVEWISPTDGDTVTAGDVACSIAAENFVLTDPAKHNEGTPLGYIEISVDEAVVTQTSSTTPTVTLEAGSHTLTAQLFLSDGDEVLTDGTNTCDEDDDACEPVVASISVTAE